jgi:hypothetical protein
MLHLLRVAREYDLGCDIGSRLRLAVGYAQLAREAVYDSVHEHCLDVMRDARGVMDADRPGIFRRRKVLDSVRLAG